MLFVNIKYTTYKYFTNLSMLFETCLSILKIPIIAKKDEVYCINISNNNQNQDKHLITIKLMDKYNPNIKIKGGKRIIGQDIQSQ